MDEAWRFVFFAGGACSGAMIVVLSGAASTTFDVSPAAAVDGLVAAAVAAAPALAAAVGGADVGWPAAGAPVFGKMAAVDAAGVGAAAFTAAGLSLGGAAATEARDGNAGFAAIVGAVDAGEGATDGTASARTLVTIARAAIGVFSGSLGRSMRESTTPAPAVAPIAVATRTTRAVRAKLGAGAK